MEHKVLSDLVQKCICCKQFTILGHPGSLTKLSEMPVRRWSGTHHSRTGRCPATNCCLGDCWTLFSPYNTKCLKIILYSPQKALSGPLLRVAHYLTRYSTSLGSDPYVTLTVEILMLFVVFVVAEGIVHVVGDGINTNVNSDGVYILHNYQITLISLWFFPLFLSCSEILSVHCCLSHTCDQLVWCKMFDNAQPNLYRLKFCCCCSRMSFHHKTVKVPLVWLIWTILLLFIVYTMENICTKARSFQMAPKSW